MVLSADNGFFSRASYVVTFEKENYESVSMPLKAGMDGWYIGNVLLGGLIGILIVDPATGAMWSLDDRVDVGLTPVPVTPPVNQPVAPPVPETEPEPAVSNDLSVLDYDHSFWQDFSTHLVTAFSFLRFPCIFEPFFP